ncbi:MAG: Crp/Fnr family transcriptional regulator [Cyanothece sp. SIO1E1]|nr:Crp/Fnr family transcriptional regulator [Cyanothece sp. SIO1E1]
MNPLTQYIRSQVSSFSGEAADILEQSFRKKEKKKGDVLLRQGDTCKDLYFLSEGISRSYSIKDGLDITTWFSFKSNFVTSFTSFFPKEPSYESIEMLTDGVLYQISYHQLLEIQTRSREIERAINYFSLLYTVQLEKRLFIIQTHSAKEKYQLILQQEPHLIQHIPNKHLASYLGITRETLSRIRSGIN